MRRLRWRRGLQTYAERRAAECSLSADPEDSYGENVYRHRSVNTLSAVKAAEEALKAWFATKEFADPNIWSCFTGSGKCKPYSQIVWSRTKKVGCGAANCPFNRRNETVVFCEYEPRGNIPGQKPYVISDA